MEILGTLCIQTPNIPSSIGLKYQFYCFNICNNSRSILRIRTFFSNNYPKYAQIWFFDTQATYDDIFPNSSNYELILMTLVGEIPKCHFFRYFSNPKIAHFFVISSTTPFASEIIYQDFRVFSLYFSSFFCHFSSLDIPKYPEIGKKFFVVQLFLNGFFSIFLFDI